MRSSCEENDILINRSKGNKDMDIHQCPYVYPITYPFPIFNIYKHKHITGNFECEVVRSVFKNNILNVCIRYIWFNKVYIIPNFFAPHFYVTVTLIKHYLISIVL